jgi:hypothetical protein
MRVGNYKPLNWQYTWIFETFPYKDAAHGGAIQSLPASGWDMAQAIIGSMLVFVLGGNAGQRSDGHVQWLHDVGGDRKMIGEMLRLKS